MEDTIIQEERESIEQEIEHKETLSNKGIENSLKEKQKHILTTLKDYRRKNGTDILWLIIWIVVLGGAMYIKKEVWSEMTILKTSIYYFCLVVASIGLLYKFDDLCKNRKMKIDSKFELSIIQEDIFLEEIKGLSYEEKALKQLSKKQADIERYLSINLAHTKIIFAIGVFIIFIGILVIVATIISTFFIQQSVQFVTIVSGFIGGLLVDSIGAVFILMYSKTIESAREYQNNMVETANTYLGNVLVSQIDNDELREQTLSVMAKKLVQRDKGTGTVDEVK